MSRRLSAVISSALLAALVVAPAAAPASTTASGYTVRTYVSGLAESARDHWGPLGIAFDQSDNLYVADTVNSTVYRFPVGGGVASAATAIDSSPIPGGITGLAFSRSGALYLARYNAGDVVQLDPRTGQILRTVAKVPCALGLAVDPVSGDLFVSQDQCGSTIYRISGFSNGPGTVTGYAQVAGADGLAFDSDGTLYAAGEGTIWKIDGTNTPTPGLTASVARVPNADGIAFGAHVSGGAPLLAANRRDGIVTKVDFGTTGGPSQTDIFSGGSRGDFDAVDSKGCLYITQSDSVLQICGSQGTGPFEPTTPGASYSGSTLSGSTSPSSVAGTKVSRARSCRRMRTLTIRLKRQVHARLRAATIYLNGQRRRTLHGRALTRPVVIKRLPIGALVLRIVATTTGARRINVKHFYANCGKTKPKPATKAKRHRHAG